MVCPSASPNRARAAQPRRFHGLRQCRETSRCGRFERIASRSRRPCTSRSSPALTGQRRRRTRWLGDSGRRSSGGAARPCGASRRAATSARNCGIRLRHANLDNDASVPREFESAGPPRTLLLLLSRCRSCLCRLGSFPAPGPWRVSSAQRAKLHAGRLALDKMVTLC